MAAFTNFNGHQFSLGPRRKKNVLELRKKYYADAAAYCEDADISVFYSLIKIEDESYGYFFRIPVNADDVEKIQQKYGENYLIGIVYSRSYVNEKPSPRTPNNKSKAEKGIEYEQRCVDYLKNDGFYDVHTTKVSGDQGIDIIAYKKGEKYGFQCKYSSKKVSNKAVQEIHSGAEIEGCKYAAVISNAPYSKSAQEAAASLNIFLLHVD